MCSAAVVVVMNTLATERTRAERRGARERPAPEVGVVQFHVHLMQMRLCEIRKLFHYIPNHTRRWIRWRTTIIYCRVRACLSYFHYQRLLVGLRPLIYAMLYITSLTQSHCVITYVVGQFWDLLVRYLSLICVYIFHSEGYLIWVIVFCRWGLRYFQSVRRRWP